MSTHALEPVPSFYQEPGLSPNRNTVNQQFQEHIDPFTGKLQIHAVDLHIPGNGGLNIDITRSYSSLNELLDQVEHTPVGLGWTMHYGRVMRRSSMLICDNNLLAGNAPVLETPDGGRHVLYLSSTMTTERTWMSTDRWKATCSTGQPGLNIYSPDGTLYEMTTAGPPMGAATQQQNSWYTTRITDRNGNTLSFGYVPVGDNISLSSITASDGRAVSFAYGGSTLSSISSGGRSWRYEYGDTAGFGYPMLTKVIRPDGGSWSYQYNHATGASAGAYSLKQVTYPTGGYFTYEYGFVSFNQNLPKTTVVSKKRDSASNAWTYIYTPATTQCDLVSTNNSTISATCSPDKGQLDHTVVVGPKLTEQHWHFGANSVFSGIVYLIGLKAGHRMGDDETEATNWGLQQISRTVNALPGAKQILDGSTVAPHMKGRYIDRNAALYTTEYSNYDEYGNPGTIAETGPDGNGTGGINTRTTQMSYYIDPAKWIIHLPRDETTDTKGIISRAYDGNGNLTREDRYGVVTGYTYDQGNLFTRTDARSKVTTFTQYKRGVPQGEDHLEGVTISRIVDDFGNVTSQTDAEGATVGYQYDDLNRITNITHAEGNPVSVVWGVNDRVLTRGSYQERSQFDPFGRLKTLIHTDLVSGNVVSQTYGYDELGRQTFASYPNQTVGTRTYYDALGRNYQTGHGMTETGNTGLAVVQQFFKANAQVELTDENNYKHLSSFRGYGNPNEQELMKLDAPEASTSQIFKRNGLGQITEFAQGGKTRKFTYYPTYFLETSTEPETGTTAFGRDEVGNMTSRQVSSAPATSYSYDDRNRLKTVTYPAGTASVTRTYYKDDKIKSIDNGVSTRNYIYNLNKQITQETLSVDGKSFLVKYGYDGNDALDTLTYGSGVVVKYMPDAMGRATQASPYVRSIVYHANGAINKMEFSNGTTTEITQNARLWPENLTINSGAATVSALKYMQYDRKGNIRVMVDSMNPMNDRTITYDAADRVQTATGPWGTNIISYDGRGNLLSQDSPADKRTYSYDPTTDLLTNLQTSKLFGSAPVNSSMNFGYDVFGNVTNNGRNQFSYNAAQQMKCTDCGLPSQTSYTYDGQGIRLSSMQGGATTYFVYGTAGNLLWELAPNGQFKEYIYVGGKQVATRRAGP